MINTNITSDLKFIDGDFTNNDYLSDLAFDNDGGFMLNDQSMVFDLNGVDLVVTYSLIVEASIIEEEGDWDTPGYNSSDITDVSVDIVNILLDGKSFDSIDLTSLENLILQNVGV